MLKGIFLRILCIACIALTQSSRLSSRKKTSVQSYDPFMICEHLGPTHSEGLPLMFNEQVYAELLSLCSSAHGAFENVGCFCSSASGSVHCDRHLADRDLWDAHFSPEDSDIIRQFEEMGFPNGNMNFQQLCEHGCECVTADDAEVWFHDHFNGDDWTELVGVEGIDETYRSPARSNNQAGGNTFAAGSLIGHDEPLDHTGSGWQNQCGNNCTSSKDCSVPVGGNGTCACQAHSSQYQPGSGTVAFVAACLVTLGSGGGGGGKRAEGTPCPCNASYVSHSCCDTLDGIVWEPPEMKLGDLVAGTEL